MKSHPCLSNELLQKDTIIMIYFCFHYKFESSLHRIRFSDQFTVNKRDADCFEHLHEGNTKTSVNISVSHAQPQFFYDFYRREGRSDGILIKWDRDADVLVTRFPPPHFGREESC